MFWCLKEILLIFSENNTMIPGFRWPNQLRSRRGIVHDKATKTTVCNIIEVMAVADYSVWNLYEYLIISLANTNLLGD